MSAGRPDYARTNARPVTVTRYRAEVTYVRHVEPGTDEVSYAECEHDHDTPAAAERCARRMARQYVEVIR